MQGCHLSYEAEFTMDTCHVSVANNMVADCCRLVVVWVTVACNIAA